MNFNFGKYKKKPIAWVMIENPTYLNWILNNAFKKYSKEYTFTSNIIKKFDNMPLKNVKCVVSNCENPVNHLTLYNGIHNGNYWFCTKCDPYSLGAREGTLSSIATFSEITSLRNNKELIKLFANAKGVPKRKTEEALKTFFSY
ncbi:hypothetical protein QJ133_10145 [Priestia megaterium]|uniref:exodeoxyribonuclease X C-terminal domain-containing protein n=1 Tax=Priestia megaterium TaxID=1404 RepID=UPI00249C142F|nr:hypothetical protein [Priestia megaterium]MDI3091489.1 hypothetical protein [Priestia megaterium]